MVYYHFQNKWFSNDYCTFIYHISLTYYIYTHCTFIKKCIFNHCNLNIYDISIDTLAFKDMEQHFNLFPVWARIVVCFSFCSYQSQHSRLYTSLIFRLIKLTSNSCLPAGYWLAENKGEDTSYSDKSSRIHVVENSLISQKWNPTSKFKSPLH